MVEAHWRAGGVGLVAAMLIALALVPLGCSSKTPRFESAERAQFTSISGKTRAATAAEIRQLVAGYREAARIDDDWGTTHPVRVDIVTRDGRSIVLRGGNPGRLEWQTVEADGVQYNIQGQRLHDLLSKVAVQLESAK